MVNRQAAVALLVAALPVTIDRLEAQEPVLLRLAAVSGVVMQYRADLDAWLQTPLLAAGDPSQPTVHVTSFITRILTSPDSQHIELTDHTDSSMFDFPAFRAMMPGRTDLLRGMRAVTRLDPRGRNVSTVLVTAPNLPTGMPALIRGVPGLVLAVARLSTVSLPERPVSPGDTWTDSLSFDLGNMPGLEGVSLQGAGMGQATMRFERVEQRGTARIAVITAVVTATGGAGDAAAAATLTISATSTIDLDLEAGRFVRSETRLAGPMVTQMGVIPVRLVMLLRAL